MVRQFLTSREVQVYRDNKPLIFNYKPYVAISQTEFQRIQRLSLFLSTTTSYSIGQASWISKPKLSRSPQPVTAEIDVNVNAMQLSQVESGPAWAIGV